MIETQPSSSDFCPKIFPVELGDWDSSLSHLNHAFVPKSCLWYLVTETQPSLPGFCPKILHVELGDWDSVSLSRLLPKILAVEFGALWLRPVRVRSPYPSPCPQCTPWTRTTPLFHCIVRLCSETLKCACPAWAKKKGTVLKTSLLHSTTVFALDKELWVNENWHKPIRRRWSIVLFISPQKEVAAFALWLATLVELTTWHTNDPRFLQELTTISKSSPVSSFSACVHCMFVCVCVSVCERERGERVLCVHLCVWMMHVRVCVCV